MQFNPDVLKLLETPLSWVVYEILAVILLGLVIFDVNKKNKDKDSTTQFIRLLEIFGFIFYAIIFENLGVLGKIYDYSLHRFMIHGTVPLTIPIFEAIIFYTAMQFAEKLDFPKWVIPFLVAFFGMLQDFTLDPVAIADKHMFNGVLQGRWNWNESQFYSDMFFGIPYFNFSGWFVLMFYYTSLILLGRKIYEKYNKKVSIGVSYVILSAIFGALLIISPLTLFLLFAYPIGPRFGSKIAEIIMLSLISIVLIGILISKGNRDKKINLKDDPIIWIIPVSMHLLDIIIMFALGLSHIYIPVIIFTIIYLAYIGFYSYRKPKQLN